MARRMRDEAFRQNQFAHRFDPHIAPINEFVASLQDPEMGRWVPQIAPMHAGTDAAVLSVLRDPGPRTRDDSGSGFLCIENDDPTAERQCQLFEKYGIAPRQVLPWNAFPWYINRAPNAAELDSGAVILGELLDRLSDPSVVLLQGTHAADVWRRLMKHRPSLVRDRELEVVESIHPGRQALWTRDADQLRARLAKQQSAYERVAMALAAR